MAGQRLKFVTVLEEMGHAALVELFTTENIDDETAAKLTDEELRRLVLETMGDRHRFRSKMSHTQSAPGSARASETEVMTERYRLFSRSGKKTKRQSRLTGWTAQFFCLASTTAHTIPTTTEKELLLKAGLGLKKIRLENEDDELEVIRKLMSIEFGYPQLSQAGGIELLRSEQNCRSLKLIGASWNSKELKTYVGSQARIYIRPIQNSLSKEPLHPLQCDEKECTTVCEACHAAVKMREMRQHVMTCVAIPDLPDMSDLLHAAAESHGVSDSDYVLILGQSTSNVNTLSEVNESPNQNDSVNFNVSNSNLVVASTSNDELDTNNANDPQNSLNDLPEVNESGIMLPYSPAVENSERTVSEVVQNVITFCKQKDIQNPVEILKKLQQKTVTGRPLEISNTEDSFEGPTNYILVDRNNVIETAFDELSSKQESELRCTLEVQFYDETAEDYGGPRKEFFKLVMMAIKEKYFDHGLRDLLSDDYQTVGTVFALSMLQNGPLPNFMDENVLQELWYGATPSPCITRLRQGLNSLGMFEIVKKLPSMEFLFHSNTVPLSVKKLTNLLKPVFSENGSNNAIPEKAVYAKFIKYMREVVSGRRQGINLNSILRFSTGADEDPILGFNLHPSIIFTENDSFIPTAQTCINRLILPRASHLIELPADDKLFQLYDYAFANAFYGLK